MIFYPGEGGNYPHVFGLVVGLDTQKFGFLMDDLSLAINNDHTIGRDAGVAAGTAVGIDLNLHDV